MAGALSVTVAGIGTAALLVTSARARDLLYHGQHLTASALYGCELWASQNVHGYAATWIFFPVIGLVMGSFGGGRRLAGAGTNKSPTPSANRTTTTGQVAWCTQCWPTEPSSASTNPP